MTTLDWITVILFGVVPIGIGAYLFVCWILSELKYKREMRIINNKNVDRLYEDCLKRIERL